ncbi:MAG: 50S ribosomal protein L29 [Mycoplasma sp.]
MLDIRDIRKKDLTELQTQLTELKQKLFALRFQNSVGKLEHPGEIASLKKDIARILTVIHEQKMGINQNWQPKVIKTPKTEVENLDSVEVIAEEKTAKLDEVKEKTSKAKVAKAKTSGTKKSVSTAPKKSAIKNIKVDKIEEKLEVIHD